MGGKKGIDLGRGKVGWRGGASGGRSCGGGFLAAAGADGGFGFLDDLDDGRTVDDGGVAEAGDELFDGGEEVDGDGVGAILGLAHDLAAGGGAFGIADGEGVGVGVEEGVDALAGAGAAEGVAMAGAAAFAGKSGEPEDDLYFGGFFRGGDAGGVFEGEGADVVDFETKVRGSDGLSSLVKQIGFLGRIHHFHSSISIS